MASGEVAKREIDVYRLTRKYVTAYCHLRKDLRTFRVSRIVYVAVTGKTYALPENIRELLAGMLGGK